MAKKKTAKRKAPMKECPKCKKSVHAATRTCECGYSFGAKRKVAKKTATRKTAAKATNVTDTIKNAKALIEQAGSVENAIEILKQFDD